MSSYSDARTAEVFERLPELLEGDGDLLRRGRYLTVECMVEIGPVPFYLSIARGRLEDLVRGPKLMQPWTFAVRGSTEAWSRFWQRVPEPGWHDLFALTKRRVASIEGDIRPLMANLQYFKDLIAAPRRIFAED